MPTELAQMNLRSGRTNVLLVAAAVLALATGGFVVYWQSQMLAHEKDDTKVHIAANLEANREPDDNAGVEANPTQEGSPGDLADSSPVADNRVEAVDLAEAKRLERIAKIKSGDWTTRQMLALSAARPYMIDFHVSINGKSLEAAEHEQIDSIADQLLRPTEMADVPMQSDGMHTDAVQNAGDSVEVANGEQPPRSPEESESDTVQPSLQNTPDAGDSLASDGIAESVDLETKLARSLDSQPLAWQELIEKPLIASGWLGNLIADDERRDQLISMYDSQRDDIVSRDELREFLSRGLSRSSPVQVADVGNSLDSRDASPWGPLDTNEDYVLDATENEQIMQRFMTLDRDGDGTLTLAEARPAMTAQTAMMQTTSVLSAKTLYALESAPDSAEIQNRSRQLSNLAGRLIEHYTFLSELSAEQWPSYPDHRWKELDKDGSGGIDRYELRRLFDLPADLSVYLRFDQEFEGGYVVYAESTDSQPTASPNLEQNDRGVEDEPNAVANVLTWTETDRGGRLDAAGLCVQIQVEDLFTSASREMVLSQVGMALKNPQLATQLQTRFELGDEAIEFADRDGDSELSSSEAATLWQWLTARQGTRLAARWMLAPEPWFQLLDKDGNDRITREESAQFVASYQSLYGQGEAVLGAGDPLLVQFVVRRSDPRFEGAADAPQNANQEPDIGLVDWFDAMDLNGDEAIDEEEFLGDLQDFTSLDTNNDGFLRRAELYVPQS